MHDITIIKINKINNEIKSAVITKSKKCKQALKTDTKLQAGLLGYLNKQANNEERKRVI